ncbi:hypothetical protein VNO78_22558 [Psophocarpus tetragonolobus]|uniref:Uncharacterized protein n=1 Tax=Psophocarpus tetragonolobus TaxID=3891 RepID=A0AAN9XCR7_PSOTE
MISHAANPIVPKNAAITKLVSKRVTQIKRDRGSFWGVVVHKANSIIVHGTAVLNGHASGIILLAKFIAYMYVVRLCNMGWGISQDVGLFCDTAWVISL